MTLQVSYIYVIKILKYRLLHIYSVLVLQNIEFWVSCDKIERGLCQKFVLAWCLKCLAWHSQ